MLKFKKFMDESVELVESHYKVGDKVKCVKSGKTGVVVKVDEPQTGEYYTVKRDDDGSMMKFAPSGLEKLDESLRKDIAQLAGKFPKGTKVRVKNARKYDSLAKTDTVSGEVLGNGKDFLMVAVGKGQMNVDIKDIVKEEIELDEISKKTLGSYVKKAGASMAAHGVAVGSSTARSGSDDERAKRSSRKMGNRNVGISRAVDRLTREEVELDEAQWGADNPYKKYKNDPERLRRMLKKNQDAAGNMRNRISKLMGSAPSGLKDELKDIENRVKQIKDVMREEVELDELDAKTYRSYHDKATADQIKRMAKAKRSKEDQHIMRKRSLGIATAGMKQYGDKRTTSQRIRGEEVELEEGRNEVLKALEGLVKRGGMDKNDFQKAHDLYKANKLMDLRKHIYRLDTDPSETIADVIARHDSKAFNSMYPRAKSGDYIRKIVIDHGGK